MLGWYIRQLSVRPYTTKCITSALICISGDCIQQTLEWNHNKQQLYINNNNSKSSSSSISKLSFFDNYNYIRSIRMGIFGAVVIGNYFISFYYLLLYYGYDFGISFIYLYYNYYISIYYRLQYILSYNYQFIKKS